MTNIKITRNCQNGEHKFIPALTHTDGRDHYVMAFVCQHCLYHVGEKEWENHIKEHFTSDPQEALLARESSSFESVSAAPYSGATPMQFDEKFQKTEQSYPGKRRGPKPKKQGSD
jgi:hypothetical protein